MKLIVLEVLLILAALSSGGSLHVFAKSNVYTSFNSRTYCNPASKILEPENVQEILHIVRAATFQGQTVKALGAQHSITDIICTDGIPVSLRKIQGVSIDKDGETATFGAGIELGTAMEFLERHGRMLPIVPAYSKITLVGAIGTGAHGSSLRHPATISDNVIALKVIVGNGTLIRVTSPEEVNAFKVHLGLLGIVTEVSLKTFQLMKMTVQNRLESDSALFSREILAQARKFDNFQIWWFPNSGDMVVSNGTFLSAQTPGNATSNFIFSEYRFGVAKSHAAFEFLQGTRNTEGLQAFAEFAKKSLYAEVIGKPPAFSENGEILSNPATGWPWRLQASECKATLGESCSWDNGDDSIYPEEFSLAFDIEKFDQVVTLIRRRVLANPFYTVLGFFIRFLKASDGLVSIATGRDTVTFGWLIPMRKNPFLHAPNQLGISQALFQELIQRFDGRPHWGKNGLHFFTSEILHKTVPNLEKFLQFMKKFDSSDTFLNKFGNRLKGISQKLDIHPDVTRCAIQDYCICSSNLDCAPFQICTNLHGYKICQDLLPIQSASPGISQFHNISHILETIAENLYNPGQELEYRLRHSSYY